MNFLMAILVVLTIAVVAMMAPAIINGGPDFITPYFTEVFAFTWQSQFNLDFGSYLILSAIWIAWRSGFSKTGIFLALFGSPMGLAFLGPYLLYLIKQSAGDPRMLLLGVHAQDTRKKM